MRVVRRVVAQILAAQAVTVRILVGVFVEVRHLGARPPESDDFDELIAIKRGLVQIGGAARRARVAAPVAVGPMAELAIRLLVKQPIAEGDILGGGGRELEGGGHDAGDGEFADVHTKLPGSSPCRNPCSPDGAHRVRPGACRRAARGRTRRVCPMINSAYPGSPVSSSAPGLRGPKERAA